MVKMEYETIQYEKRGHVAYVTLNRPDKLNAMDARMHRELGQAWEDFRDDDKMLVAILSGNGRCFSAGADLSGGAGTGRYRYDGQFPDITTTRDVYKPIIAALHSHVIGYGLWIALDADIRIAADDIEMWLPEPQWGIATIPAAWLPRLMPWAVAAELLLLADKVNAERAYQLGLVNRVVPPDQLMAAAEKAAARIIELSPVAVQTMKEMMVRASRLDYTAVDQITASALTRSNTSEDRREGARAFLEKRKGQWPGVRASSET
jgi:enoyl-CoA hydratase/carnithine racemase